MKSSADISNFQIVLEDILTTSTIDIRKNLFIFSFLSFLFFGFKINPDNLRLFGFLFEAHEVFSLKFNLIKLFFLLINLYFLILFIVRGAIEILTWRIKFLSINKDNSPNPADFNSMTSEEIIEILKHGFNKSNRKRIGFFSYILVFLKFSFDYLLPICFGIGAIIIIVTASVDQFALQACLDVFYGITSHST